MALPDSGSRDAFVIPEPPDAGEVEPAREAIYIHTGDTLYSWDPADNAKTAIGTFHTRDREVTNVVDIAIDLDGTMFGGTTEREIFRIDPETALCTYLSTYDDILHGLTFLSDGRLVVAGRRVAIVDPMSARVLDELVGEGRFETSGDIIGLPDGKLYWTVRGARDEGDQLVRIDPANGNASLLGGGPVAGLYGLGFAYGELYGFSRDGVVVELNQRTGDVLDTRTLEGRWYGATTNPVLW
jgi:hypothetical protein